VNESIFIETDLFEHREVKPHFINPCCFGEDFAAWLKQELSRFPELRVDLSNPIQEDYGWGLWATRGKDRVWIAISYVGDGPQEAPPQSVVSVTYDPGLSLTNVCFTNLTRKPNRSFGIAFGKFSNPTVRSRRSSHEGLQSGALDPTQTRLSSAARGRTTENARGVDEVCGIGKRLPSAGRVG